jgi:lipopolysaccharide export system protein LptC
VVRPRKDYLRFVVNMLPVMIYFTDYWNALDKLSAAAQALSTGDIATYDSGALDALNLENEGNASFTMGITSLKALL